MGDSTVNLEDITFDPLRLSAFAKSGPELTVLRLDKIHPEISGNKWFKLKYYLETAKLQKKERLISFGGPYSNHLVALACAAHAYGFLSTGFVRGEKPDFHTASLFTAQKYGMDLQFLSREEYRRKEDEGFLSSLQSAYPEALIIPEGGSGEPGIRGSGEILSQLDTAGYSHICCAIGTGTTLAGLVSSSQAHQQLIGISILKGTGRPSALQSNGIKAAEKSDRLQYFHEYHFGGYAKKTSVLLDFMNSVYDQSGIPTDFVYTGKLFYAVTDLVRLNYFPEKSRILIVHSGGLQGNLSLPEGQLHF